jgi:hypothetical protein
MSLLALLWEVASQLQLTASDSRVLAALVLFLAGSALLGRTLSIGASSGQRTAILLPTAMRDFAVAAPLGIYGILVLVFGTVVVSVLKR